MASRSTSRAAIARKRGNTAIRDRQTARALSKNAAAPAIQAIAAAFWLKTPKLTRFMSIPKTRRLAFRISKPPMDCAGALTPSFAQSKRNLQIVCPPARIYKIALLPIALPDLCVGIQLVLGISEAFLGRLDDLVSRLPIRFIRQGFLELII
jgi:hypothetical protein